MKKIEKLVAAVAQKKQAEKALKETALAKYEDLNKNRALAVEQRLLRVEELLGID